MDRLLTALREVKDDVDFASETALIDDGLIDSLDLTQILLALDEAFDIHIPAGEIEPENFNDVDAMLALVHRYQS
ncbi:MAG: acyl carrier protein [Clostridia bacterium]|nr:acyl carrier protein [Clostridia bacterium]MBQ3485861.1 acyl carrier protein [Clostridia bacterium]